MRGLPNGPIRVPKNGQVAIPKKVRDEAGLSEGDEVFLMSRQGTILIVKAADVRQRVDGIYTDLALGESIDEDEGERSKEARHQGNKRKPPRQPQG